MLFIEKYLVVSVYIALCAFRGHDCSSVDMHDTQSSVFEIIQWHSNVLKLAVFFFICLWYCSGG